jgi:PiT family inorganic phosphate transporter
MLLWTALIFGTMLFVAYANGANDNFKGVATLFGSGTTDYKRALWWATATTLAGSMAAWLLAPKLIATFQGKDLIPAALAGSKPFLVAVILGAAFTVFLATTLGAPISTTHSLTGALLGAGLAAVGLDLSVSILWTSFLRPLLVSPLLAVGLAVLVYPLFRIATNSTGLRREACLCVGEEFVPVAVAITAEGRAVTCGTRSIRVAIDDERNCVQRYTGTMLGVNVQTLLDGVHWLSAGAVSFARGLNDTPKIVALSMAVGGLNLSWRVTLVALFMALGGLLHAQGVAETVSKRITAMDPDQGVIANLVTSVLVICASRWGLPVSTTHVSCGALFGIGATGGKAHWGVVRNIVLAWVVTLPLAALLAAGIYAVLQRIVS